LEELQKRKENILKDFSHLENKRLLLSNDFRLVNFKENILNIGKKQILKMTSAFKNNFLLLENYKIINKVEHHSVKVEELKFNEFCQKWSQILKNRFNDGKKIPEVRIKFMLY
jgi:hypothetical protein